VGRAATSGIGFLPIYLGPTLMAALWWYVMLKIIRISKQNRITSIADFHRVTLREGARRWGIGDGHRGSRRHTLYRPAAQSHIQHVSIILRYPEVTAPEPGGTLLFLGDNTFYIAMLLAAFTILSEHVT